MNYEQYLLKSVIIEGGKIMSQIYLAGPFFRGANRSSKSYRKALEENKTVTSFYSPRHHQESNYELFSAGWAQEVYEKIWKN